MAWKVHAAAIVSAYTEAHAIVREVGERAAAVFAYEFVSP